MIPRKRRVSPHFLQPESDATASSEHAVQLASTVIRWANRESPADHVLRAELKKAVGLNRATSRLTARMVFAYYRWFGWLESGKPVSSQVEQALEMQARFNSNPGSFPDAELVEKAVPVWTRDFMDVSPAWVRSLQSEPTLWLRAKPGQGEFLVGKLWTATPGPVPDSLIYTGQDDLFVRDEFQNGDFEIQDIASQIVGHLCAPQPKETWWDACAGEGGKTMHLSALMENKGLIWASDRADWRLTRLKRRAARAKAFNYRTARWDGGETLPTKTLFDGVLVDAPCTGIGTWQRNPHARWTAGPEDVTELATIQGNLLGRVAKSIKKGGRLIYSVCTMARAETTDISERFSAAHPDFRLEAFEAAFLPTTDSKPEVWLHPQQWKGNGMFVVQWRRT